MKFLKSVFNRHALLHGAFMVIGMVFPMVAMAASATGASVTLGDIAVGSVDMLFSMIFDGFNAMLDIVPDLVENTFDGNFAPSSYEIGSMSDMYEMGSHTVADGAVHMEYNVEEVVSEHARHHVLSPPVEEVDIQLENTAAASTSATTLTETFSSRSEWFQSLPLETQDKYSSMANAMGQSIEDYTLGMCNANIPKNW